MKRLLFPIVSGLFLLSIFGLTSTVLQQQPSPTAESTENALLTTVTPVTDESYVQSTDEELLVETLENACAIEEQAQWTFDTGEYPTVFINDPRYPLSAEVMDYVRDIKNDPSIVGIGYLDFEIAEILRQQECTLKWKNLLDAMQKENRERMTAEEKASLFTSGGRMCPAPTDPSLKGNVPCKYAIQSIKIGEDTATVVASRGATTDEWYFVKKDGQWYIAGRKVLLKHP